MSSGGDDTYGPWEPQAALWKALLTDQPTCAHLARLREVVLPTSGALSPDVWWGVWNGLVSFHAQTVDEVNALGLLTSFVIRNARSLLLTQPERWVATQPWSAIPQP